MKPKLREISRINDFKSNPSSAQKTSLTKMAGFDRLKGTKKAGRKSPRLITQLKY
jgi:hypothetical protein